MGLNKYAKRRDKNERLIVDTLRLGGAHVDLLDRPVDLLIGYRQITVLAEVKAPRAEPNKTQRDWLSTWHGGRRCVLRTTADAQALLEEIDAEGR